MRLKILKEIDVDGYTLWAYLGDIAEVWSEEPFGFGGKEYTSIEDFEHDYPGLVAIQPGYRGLKTIVLKIDINTGEVCNWPRKGLKYDFHDFKICDSGYYTLLDDEFDPIVIIDGYVPRCLGEGGYGDYLEFEVNGDGYIPDWSFTQEHFDAMIKEAQNY